MNTLKELFSLDCFKGYRLYIDLWATWCLPCKAEFLRKTESDAIAKKYNVKLVYLSIDEANFKNRWESDIFKFNLNGYHFIANESLMKDIEKVIYKNHPIAIPQYLFINEKGEIINYNAPRPSAVNEIEKIFSGV